MSEASDVAELATKAAGAPVMLTVNGRNLIYSPDNWDEHVDVKKQDDHGLLLDPPSRVVEDVQLGERLSFIEYVTKYKRENTVVYGNPKDGRFKAIVDYHTPGAYPAGFASHKVYLTQGYSEEFNRWTSLDKALKTREEFATFLLENEDDLVSPKGADLREFVSDMAAVKTGAFTGHVRLKTGGHQFSYTEETKVSSAKGAVEAPDEFVLSIPIYYGDDKVELKAFLRYRMVDGGDLLLGYALHRVTYAKLGSFEKLAAMIRDKTKCPVFMTASA